MALVIALANQKGGVAKTTTCLNLGAGFARRGFRTLLIDGDPQGSLTKYLAHRSENSEFSPLGDWLLGRKPFQDIEVKTPYEGLSFVPADQRLIAAELQMSKDVFKAIHYLRFKIEEIKKYFDVVLVDTSPSFSTMFANALVAADHVVIPIKLEWLSVQGLGEILQKIRELQETGKQLNILGLLGTFRRKGVNEVAKCLSELNDALPGKLFNTTIHLNSRVAEAAGAGLPIQNFDKLSQGALDYESLTDEVMARTGLKSVPVVA